MVRRKTMGIEEKGYTVQCINCLCILGISSENFQEREIYCMRCVKEKIKATQNTRGKNNG